MPKVVTFSVFLPSVSSSSAVCANAGPHAVHNSNAAIRSLIIAPLVEGATLYPAPARDLLRREWIFVLRSNFAASDDCQLNHAPPKNSMLRGRDQ